PGFGNVRGVVTGTVDASRIDRFAPLHVPASRHISPSASSLPVENAQRVVGNRSDENLLWFSDGPVKADPVTGEKHKTKAHRRIQHSVQVNLSHPPYETVGRPSAE